jgi:hypothetical protein
VPSDRDSIERRLYRTEWRIGSLFAWRKTVDRRLDEIEEEVEGMTRTKEIAEAVAAELEKRQPRPARISLTWWQKLGGIAAGAILVIDAAKGLLS